MRSPPPARRSLAHMRPLGLTCLQPRNPWMAAFFAFSFPGFGYLLLQRYLAAFTFIGWEVFINTKAHLNLGILYSLLGRFDQAKSTLNADWLILYVTVYIFNIWDSYRLSVDLNKQYRLARHENADIPNTRISFWDIDFQDKKRPSTALVWSLLVPGTGHLYAHKMLTGLFILTATLVVATLSRIPMSIHDFAAGDFASVIRTLDMQWAMYLPSMYTFFVYDAYGSVVAQNKLFELEQAQYLKQHYQSPEFPMPMQEW